MRLTYILCLLSAYVFLFSQMAIAQVDPEIDARLEKRWHPCTDFSMPYRLLVPDGYSSSQAYPLILFLHGAMWRGSDNITQLDNELAVFWVQEAAQSIQPCFVVLPQCPTHQTWEVVSGKVDSFPPSPMLENVMDLVDSLSREFAIDAERIYCVGKSMGGLGVYGLLSRYPDRFAAVMPVAGIPVYQDISRISEIPIWILHAKDDPSVSIDVFMNMVHLLEETGPSFIYTHCNALLQQCEPIPHDSMDQVIAAGESRIISIFDTATHQIEPKVIRTYGLAEWLLSQQKRETGIPSNTSHPGPTLCTNFPNPFNPATHIQYELAKNARVDVRIFNTAGRCVRRLLTENQNQGIHTIRWGGRNDQGHLQASGVYLCQIWTNRLVYVHKLLLIR